MSLNLAKLFPQSTSVETRRHCLRAPRPLPLGAAGPSFMSRVVFLLRLSDVGEEPLLAEPRIRAD